MTDNERARLVLAGAKDHPSGWFLCESLLAAEFAAVRREAEAQQACDAKVLQAADAWAEGAREYGVNESLEAFAAAELKLIAAVKARRDKR